MCKKEIQFLSFFSLVIFLTISVYAQDKVLQIGGKEGWPVLSVQDNIVSGKGRFGYEAKMLTTNSKKLTSETDLLLSFEDEFMTDSAENYSIITNELEKTSKSAMGNSAGMSLGSNGLLLKGDSSSVFGSSGYKDSLTISFWLYPSLAESGEIIFSWRSSRNSAVYSTYQTINASFFNGKIEWRFMNVFTNEEDVEKEIILTSYSTVIPNVWAHHCFIYNEAEGSLEYYLNGSLEVIQYATISGSYDTDILKLFLGVPADIAICPKFSGIIDDFSIVNTVAEPVDCFDMCCSGGRIETQPIDTGFYGSSMKRIEGEVSIPEQTGLQFFVRGGDNFYEWDDEFPEWQAARLDHDIEDVKGKYFQIAVELFPDGSGEKTPSVTGIDIFYDEISPPLAPYYIDAISGDGYVDVTWSKSMDSNIGGYYLYYGEKSGEYLGRQATQGASPIYMENKNSIRVSGLINGKIYYFAVSSCSALDQRIIGVLSKEVYARPLKK